MSSLNRIIVIGAGAAGMMAAGRAAERGAGVLLLEKMERPGRKILITGNGRCNLTNSCDLETFIACFGANGRFLYSAFSRFFRDDLLGFFRRYGIECRTEPGGKIYPVTDNARDILRVSQRYLSDTGVKTRCGVTVTGLLRENGRVTGVTTGTGNLPASAVILAAGGSSHPQTGSSGDGYRIAESVGHTIVPLRPGLVPLVITDIERAKRMQGIGFSDARITAFRCHASEIDSSRIPAYDVGGRMGSRHPKPPVIESRTGNAVITHFGLSGPVILEMSLAIVDALKFGPVSLTIDIMPGKDKPRLRQELQQAFEQNSHRTLHNILDDFLSPKLADNLIEIAGIIPEKTGGLITAPEREKLLELIKSLRFDIKGAYSMAAAIVTAGGISLDEIDPRTMASRLVNGLYVCGEVIDLDAGTGGYNLQAAFSTGYIAGESAASAIKER